MKNPVRNIADQRPSKAPALTHEAQALHDELAKEYAITDPAGLAILQVACEAHDRMRRAQTRIAAEGDTFADRFGQLRPHPLLVVERDARSQFLSALRQLNLDLEPLRDRPGRPPGR